MDYETLITKPIADGNVCGENLEDDSGFQSFFFTAQGTPERFDGQNTLPAEPPDWREIKKTALSYLEKTKDIQLIGVLSQAVLNTESVVAFESCMKGLAGLVKEQWENVYPPLDEDDGDPMERSSALGLLNHSFIIDTLKHMPLVSVKGVGSATLVTIEKAMHNDDDAPMTISQIKGMFSDAQKDAIEDTYKAVCESILHLNDIVQCFIDNSGHSYAPDFERVNLVLSQLKQAIEQNANISLEASATETQSGDEALADSSANGNSPAGVDIHPTNSTQTAFVESGKLNSRKDVEKCLQMIMEYYAEAEPSSPIPILINRAQKLIHADFLQIMQDIYPDAVSTLQALGGMTDDVDEVGDSSTAAKNDGW